MLAQDGAALTRLELIEAAGAPKRIPDGPRPTGVQHISLRALDEPKLKILLVAGRIGAADHRKLGARLEPSSGRCREDRAEIAHKLSRLKREGEEAEPARIVEVAVDHAAKPRLFEARLELIERPIKGDVFASAIDEELHEDAAIGVDDLTVLPAPALADLDLKIGAHRDGSGLLSFFFAHGFCSVS